MIDSIHRLVKEVKCHLIRKVQKGFCDRFCSFLTGRSTAKVFTQSGIAVDFVPEKTFSEGFLEVFPRAEKEDDKILLVQAERARPLLYEGLINAGWIVDKTVAYRNINSEVEANLLLEAKNADAIIFTASSAVNRYHELIGVPQPPNALCIGPITGESARILAS